MSAVTDKFYDALQALIADKDSLYKVEIRVRYKDDCRSTLTFDLSEEYIID